MIFNNSFRVRLTSLFLIVFGTTLVIFSLVLYRDYLKSHQTDFDAALYNYAVDIAQSLDISTFGDVELRDRMFREKVFPFSFGRAFIQIRMMSGEIIARSVTLGNAELKITKEELGVLVQGQTVYRILSPKESGLPIQGTFRQINYLISRPPIPRMVLQIAVPTTFLDRQMGSLFTFFVIWIPIVLVVAAIGGYYMAGNALKPIRAITQKAKEITVTDLNVRVPVPQADDELRELANTLNDLLNRLQLAFDSQDQFVANASHQLKTPLAIMRGELQLILSKSRSMAEIQEFHESTMQELEHLSKIVEDLLLIAKMNAGKSDFIMNPLTLDDPAMDAVASLRRYAERRNVRLKLEFVENTDEEVDFEILGDWDLLKSMFFNLIENAIKFSSEGGVVKIELENKGEMLSVRIVDQGRGIDKETAEKVFERFQRGGAGSIPGVGLGLSIARQIAVLHGGSLNLISPPEGGAVLTVLIPSLKK